jgi:hypothetical protein
MLEKSNSTDELASREAATSKGGMESKMGHLPVIKRYLLSGESASDCCFLQLRNSTVSPCLTFYLATAPQPQKKHALVHYQTVCLKACTVVLKACTITPYCIATHPFPCLGSYVPIGPTMSMQSLDPTFSLVAAMHVFIHAASTGAAFLVPSSLPIASEGPSGRAAAMPAQGDVMKPSAQPVGMS